MAPSNVNPQDTGAVSPTQAPTVPPAMSAQAATSAQPATPVQPTQPAVQPQPTQQPTAAQPQPPVSRHARIFDSILNMVGGGTQYKNVTDPETGAVTRTPIQQSRGQLGRNVLAAALAAMVAGADARDKEGRHDPMKAAALGYEAGGQPMAKRVGELQQASDEDIARRQMVMKNNLDLVHQQVMSAHQQHVDLTETSDRNNAGILADAANFDKNLSGADVNDPTKKAILGQHLTHEEALAKLQGHWSDTSAIVDGYQDIRNPQTGVMEVHPTYAVLNPNVSIRMSEAQAKEFARFKPAYANAYAATGGNLTVGLHNYVADTNQLNSLEQTEAFFKRVQDQIGAKDVPDFASVVREGGQPVLDAVRDVQIALGQQGDATDALKRLSGSGGGQILLSKMGITNDQVNKLYNDKVAAAKLAAEGGMGEKAPMAQDQANRAISAVQNNPDLTDADKKILMADIPSPDKTGAIHMTQGQGQKLLNSAREMSATNKGIAEKNALANGDPVQLQKSASNIIEGDVNNITKIASMRGNARTNLVNALHDEAVTRGLDPTEYSEAAIDAKADALKSYSAAGKIGQQIASFRSFIGHEAEAVNANEAWTRMNSPLLNRPLSWIATNASNDPNYIRLKAALGAPAKEYQNFLNQNRAEHEADLKQMDVVLDANSTPLQINAALKELAKTADVRLASLGKGYTATVGTNFTGLLDPDSKATLLKLVPDATSPNYTVALPRGWQGGKAQPMTDKNIARAYFQAAGNDKAQAQNLARKNGWTIQ